MRRDMQTVDYKKLMELGFPEHTSRDIIRQAKRIAVQRFNNTKKEADVVKLACSPFDNPRVGVAPTAIIEEILDLSLD